ncbi:TylF/MycF family methyltransferase [Nocardioides litoris]|uniref:TylF/MycF family methyltransferase n=1 Tax=Nocardioides litoris TaxID=1926648 RepID=UPI001B869268|nr:TylF/MycF family methyltransferase [Nocardioides litoris]
MTTPATTPAAAASPAVDLYLDVMAKVLTRYGFEGRNASVRFKPRSYEGYLWRMVRNATRDRDLRVVEPGELDREARENGRDWPADAESMVGLKRLANVRHCLESVLADSVPGDFVETGAWRGGTCIYARAVLAAHGVTDRDVWVADSFEGLPAPDGRFAADAGDQHHVEPDLAVSVEQVQDNFRRYDLLDDHVRFLVGWFADTLPTAPIEQVAVLRLDGDMYSSTIDGLEPLYDKVSTGGYVVVDDYGAVKGCAQAIHDFRARRGITDELVPIDWAGVYWRKS